MRWGLVTKLVVAFVSLILYPISLLLWDGEVEAFLQGTKEDLMMDCSDLLETGGGCVRWRREIFSNWAGNVRSDGKVSCADTEEIFKI